MVALGIGKRSETVFTALSKLGPGWHTRSEIAGQLKPGRNRLFEYELAALEMLVVLKSVEAQRIETGKAIPLKWVYRIKPKNV